VAIRKESWDPSSATPDSSVASPITPILYFLVPFKPAFLSIHLVTTIYVVLYPNLRDFVEME
jgi:hypothetical protein